MAETAPIDVVIVAEKHPAYYLIHKYWSRKPHNLVRAYVEHHTRPGEIILDPFAGSAVTLIESLLSDRKAIAVDINPIAALIAEATVLPFDQDRLVEAFQAIERSIRPQIDELFRTICPDCSSGCTISHVVWLSGRAPEPHETMIEIVYVCPACGKQQRAKQPDAEDLRRFSAILAAPADSAVKQPRMFANRRTLVRAGMAIADLFTARNLAALSLIAGAIEQIADPQTRRVFECTFTACVAQASRLIPYRNGLTTGGPAWTVAGFWVPARHLEINAWSCFANRFQKTLRGKNALARLLARRSYRPARSFDDLLRDRNAWIVTHTATDLRRLIPDASVDYIFTDPPYGDSVPYLEYSTIWSGWFDRPIDYAGEIVVSDSQERAKDLGDYRALLAQAFAECYRVLKPGHSMTLTFNNRSLGTWSAIVGAIVDARFEFVSCLYQIPAVVPAKAQLARDGSAIGDIILNFRKPAAPAARPAPPAASALDIILAEAEQVIGERGGVASADEVMRGVVLALLRAGHTAMPAPGLRQLCAQRFVAHKSQWRFRDEEQHLVGKYEQIAARTRAIVERCRDQAIHDRRQIIAQIVAELPGGRMPGLALIHMIIEDVMSNSASAL